MLVSYAVVDHRDVVLTTQRRQSFSSSFPRYDNSHLTDGILIEELADEFLNVSQTHQQRYEVKGEREMTNLSVPQREIEPG